MNTFPFTAVVGMELAKKSLIYHAIDPRIGGTLFLGHRGCAKSTLVRGFAKILAAATKDRAPFIELPLGTTEDRLLGSVNAEVLVDQGKWQGRSGLIEEANGGILYIDEINLLSDHLADLILDSSASGQHRMERDGFTRQIATRYILVGTMNPEEGDLRPQLSDRFAHGVKIRDDFTPEERMEIVQRRMHFDDEPESFISSYTKATQELAASIDVARSRLKEVEVTTELRRAVALKAGELHLEGVRAELAVLRTARCSAVWQKRASVQESDLAEAWELCLGHRQTDQHPPAQHPPQNSSSPSMKQAPSSSRSPERMAPEPRQARPDIRSLLPMENKAHDNLLKWWLKPAASGALHSFQNKGMISTVPSPASIFWVETLSRSIRNGWRQGGKGLLLHRHQPHRRKNLWCFLDASRSTGASHFLDTARNVLSALAQASKTARFHLLILDQHGTRWLTRRANARRFQSVLSHLQTAGGKSLIAPALKLLHRHRLRSGASVRDHVLICSDGLATPSEGEKPGQTWRGLRQRVQQMSRSHAPIGWLHPAPKRGLSPWLERICNVPRVTRFQS